MEIKGITTQKWIHPETKEVRYYIAWRVLEDFIGVKFVDVGKRRSEMQFENVKISRDEYDRLCPGPMAKCWVTEDAEVHVKYVHPRVVDNIKNAISDLIVK